MNDRPDPSATTQAVKKSPRAFTLVELLVVIAIVGALAALVIPAVQSATLSAKSAKTLSNLKQTGLIVQNYITEKDGRLPLSADWNSFPSWFQAILADFAGLKIEWAKAYPLPDIFYDPSLKGRKEHPFGSFGVNNAIILDSSDASKKFNNSLGIMISAVPSPSRKVIVCSAIEPGWESTWGFEGEKVAQQGLNPGIARPDPRFSGLVCALFLDGHTEKIDVKNMDQATRRKYFTLDP